jgi:hypothetical protein
VLGEMDFYPLPDRCQGSSLDLSAFSDDTEHDRDFNSASKGGFTFRGAYAGEGTNPGWQIDAGNKGTPAIVPPDEAPDEAPDATADAPPDAAAEPVPDASADGPGDDVDGGGPSSGCGCLMIR